MRDLRPRAPEGFDRPGRRAFGTLWITSGFPGGEPPDWLRILGTDFVCLRWLLKAPLRMCRQQSQAVMRFVVRRAVRPSHRGAPAPHTVHGGARPDPGLLRRPH